MPSYIALARHAALPAVLAFGVACSSHESTAPRNRPPANKPPADTPRDPTGKPTPSVQVIQLDGDREVVHTYMGWLHAKPQDAEGRPVAASVTWRSSDANVVVVDAGGAMRGISPGKAVVTAQADGKSAQLEVTVVPRRVTSFQQTNPPAMLQRGDVGYFGTVALDQKGQWIHEPKLVYTSADPSIVSVDRGHLHAHRGGETRVTATADGVSTSHIVKVAAETTYPIKYANGNLLPWLVMENTVEEGASTVTTRLVMTEASFTLSNTSDSWSQRTVVDEYRISETNGNRITTKVGTHVSTSGGAFTMDPATGRLHLTVNGDPQARLEAWYQDGNVRKLRVHAHPTNEQNAWLNDYWR